MSDHGCGCGVGQGVARAKRAADPRPASTTATGHGEPNTHNLPTGAALRAILTDQFGGQRRRWRVWLRSLRTDARSLDRVVRKAGPTPPPDVTTDTPALANRSMPVLSEIVRSGERRLAAQVEGRPIRRVTNDQVIRAAETAAFDFAATTNRTTSQLLAVALDRLRTDLAAGVNRGESVERLTRRVETVFDQAERSRARTIARTEAMRASNRGLMLAGEASGVVRGWRWLLSAGACPICVDIARTMPEIPLGGEFGRVGSSATYGVIRHPPAHPNCTCTIQAVLVARTVAPAPARPGVLQTARQVVGSINDVIDLVGDARQVIGTARETIGRVRAGDKVTIGDLFGLARDVVSLTSDTRGAVADIREIGAPIDPASRPTGILGAAQTVADRVGDVRTVIDAVGNARAAVDLARQAPAAVSGLLTTFRVDPRLAQPAFPRYPDEVYDASNGRAVRIRTEDRTYFGDSDDYAEGKRQMDATIARVLGRPLPVDRLLDVAGIPKGRRVVVRHDEYEDAIIAETITDELDLRVHIKPRRNAVKIDQFYSRIGDGFGVKTFLKIAEQARAEGFERITMLAAGSAQEVEQGGPSAQNGYYTWPLFGADAPIPRRLLDSARFALGPDVARLSDLMATPQGRKWWRENGAMVECEFDLAEGSGSMRQLERYQDERLRRLDQ